jgi:hypothetical protein
VFTIPDAKPGKADALAEVAAKNNTPVFKVGGAHSIRQILELCSCMPMPSSDVFAAGGLHALDGVGSVMSLSSFCVSIF